MTVSLSARTGIELSRLSLFSDSGYRSTFAVLAAKASVVHFAFQAPAGGDGR
jgi:hypothetical protein